MQPTVAAVPQEFLAHLGPLDGVEVLPYDARAEDTVPGAGRDVDVLVLPFYPTPWLGRMGEVPGLRAVVLATAGYEHAVPFVPAGVDLANAVAVHDTPTAEMALALVLASQRALPTYVRAQDRGTWDTSAVGQERALADSRVLILGYGGIGRALARRLLACEAEVVAVASRARIGDELADPVHGVDELPELLPLADVLVVAVPLSDRTRGLVDADVLAALPDGALVVNVARGPVVDTDALLRECGSGRLRAAVDVTDPEPLPDGHPFFTTPNVLVSPHVGGGTPAAFPRMGAYATIQLGAFRESGRLAHVVHTG